MEQQLQAIKEILVQLAIDDKLNGDINQLDVSVFAPVFQQRKQQYKVFYFVVTSWMTWGRGIELKKAMENAKVNDCKKEFVIYEGICKEDTTPEQLENIAACYTVNFSGGLSMYDNPSDEDKTMVREYLLGWHTDNSFIK